MTWRLVDFIPSMAEWKKTSILWVIENEQRSERLSFETLFYLTSLAMAILESDILTFTVAFRSGQFPPIIGQRLYRLLSSIAMHQA
jgi:hypothetical protein